jgi:threonine aldolase
MKYLKNPYLSASCGDDGYNEDYNIHKLEKHMAELTGKEAALFVLTGTMGNFLSIIASVKRGEEVMVGNMSHLGNFEQGNLSQFGGIPIKAIPTEQD